MNQKPWHEYENPYQLFNEVDENGKPIIKLEHYLEEPPSAFFLTMMKEITDNMKGPSE